MRQPVFYAGIGSQETPHNVLKYMTEVAERLAKIGYILRSGGAKGADSAFEKGAGKAKVILRPEHATVEAIREAARHHPTWTKCGSYVQRLHGRNVMIILGEDDLGDPDQWVQFVVCWTLPGIPRGGTKLGMRVAEENKIPVFNLAVIGEKKRLEGLLAKLSS